MKKITIDRLWLEVLVVKNDYLKSYPQFIDMMLPEIFAHIESAKYLLAKDLPPKKRILLTKNTNEKTSNN